MRKLSRSFVILFFLVFCGFSFLPMQSRAAAATDPGYDITGYNVDINIGSDNVFHVTDTITVNFRVPSHGIYLKIPLRQEMQWNEGGSMKRIVYNTSITSINVFSDPFQTYREDANLVIQIGASDKNLTGKKVYKISYDHTLGNDKIKTQDFVYYNIIGPDWSCPISNVSFSIETPKGFDANKLWFFSGSYGAAANAPVKYTLSGNSISGTLNRSLNTGEALTVQMDLPEGYFTFPEVFPWQYVFIAAAVLFAALSILFFILFGRDDYLVKPVEFYPPDGITSAEAGYIIDNVVNDKDVVSLIIYWASKGYLTIEQLEADDFKLTKIKDLPERPNEYEQNLFSAVFKDRDTVLLSELKQKIYLQVAETKKLVRKYYTAKERLLYSRQAYAMGGLSLFLTALPIFGSLFLTVYLMYYSLTLTLAFSFVAAVLILMPINYMKSVAYRWNVMHTAKRIIMLSLGVIFEGAVLCAYVYYMNWQGMLLAGAVVAGATAVSGFFCIFMRKRTKYGNEIIGKLLGFKKFLEVAEKDRIERLVEENPSYFYDVLPYAYVMGVSDRWANKFEGIAMEPPSWYVYNQSDAFSTLLFYNMMFHSMSSMRTAMVTPPVQTGRGGFGGVGGGGFGGGGFSGGGFGGGGGGRW